MKCRFLVAAALLAAACSSQAAVVYGSNLIVNGDAEAGASGWTGYAGYSMFQSVGYGSNAVLPTQPGPVDRGAAMFAGLGQYAVGYQTLDLGIAVGQQLSYSLSGWLGGWANQGDNALLYVQFLDGSNHELGSSAIGPVTAEDRANQTGLYYRESGGFVPTGTSALAFWLSMERVGGGDNDGYADNLSFILREAEIAVPEPGVGSMFLLGFGMLGWARRGKKRSDRLIVVRRRLAE